MRIRMVWEGVVDDFKSPFSLWEYAPSVFMPLYGSMQKISFVRRMRFFFEYFYKDRYKVYYLSSGEKYVGYCVVAPGGRRLRVSSRQDVVLGPYFVFEQYRGRGYSKILLQLTLKYCSYPYNYAYDWIHETNKASIRASEAVGFEAVGRLRVVGMMRRLILSKDGDHIIYRYQKT